MQSFNSSSTLEVDIPSDTFINYDSSESPTPQTFEALSPPTQTVCDLAVNPERTSPQSTNSDTSEAGTDIEIERSANAKSHGTVLLLKTSQIRVDASKLSRVDRKFDSKGFKKLSHDISITRVNIEPITVRQLPFFGASCENQYELVSGYLRLQACISHGLQVLAIVISAPRSQSFDVDLLKSNLHRQSLSPYEFGLQLRRILNAGDFDSDTRLAEEIGASKSQVSRSLSLADLPPAVIAAFLDPQKLRLLDGPALTKALGKDAEEVLAEASLIVSEAIRPDERDVVKRLLAAAGMGSGVAPCNNSRKLIVKDRVVGNLTVIKGGNVEVQFSVSVSEEEQTLFQKRLEELLDSCVEDLEESTDDNVVENNASEKAPPPM